MKFLFFSTVLGSLALAAPTSHLNHEVHEKRNAAPHAWTKHSPAVGSQALPIRIGLKQRNLHRSAEFIDDVASPFSKNFGKHWTPEQVANAFAPSQESVDTTLDWLVTSGIDRSRISHSKGRNWLEFTGTVDEAEALFNTKYHVYQEKQSGGFRMACDEYSLPQHVRKHVDMVMPTIQLDGLKPIANAKTAIMAPVPITGLNGTKDCGRLITIDCLRALYNFPAGKYAHKGNQLGIAEWADFLYLPDLKIFLQNFTNPKIPDTTVPEFISIDGGQPSNLTVAKAGDVIESALDFQTAYSIIWPQQTRLYQNGDGVNVDSVGTFNIFLDALDGSYCTYKGGDEPYIDPAYPDPNEGGYTGPLQCGGAPVSNVFSVSYGQIEGALPRFYQERQCHEWMKLALQGVSVLYASGDSGVANRYNAGYNNSCLTQDPETGGVYVDSAGKRFSPSFPVNCPYITAVGATQLKTKDIKDGEVAVSGPDKANPLLDFYSGGGFSDIFEMPSYQASAVTNYLNKYAPKYGPAVYNTSGCARGFPDVSAAGLNLTTVYLGKTYGVGGTSASAPIVASLVTLLNEERLQAGKGPLGFLNPIFYAHPEAFNDITEGSNPGCGTQGFPAAPGWDPVTGLGTPNWEKLRAIALRLP
ncbi:subtilisin-like protein [Myriangium duriaei CBS 260.36]|uniref:tripeptidyl-peptidase II n=1 Tax=Myriangium duriaei CBS 260.36 TaxID=1168546 RepID=A0A9P4JAQ3_9PEZI|nr:subtilisin-like protein [Myriangium duriaei CBS 260.36]